MDINISEILTSWGLGSLVDVFNENNINGNNFTKLSREHIKELIPNIGTRVDFQEKFDIYVALNTKTESSSNASLSNISTSSTVTYASSLGDSLSNYDAILDSPEQIINNDTDMISETATTSSANILQDVPVLRINNIENIPIIINSQTFDLNSTNMLKDILQSSSTGKYILSYYKQNNQLSREARQKLVDLIINFELADNYDKRLTPATMEEYSSAICDLFPKERKETYFVKMKVVNKNNKVQNVGKGKLFTKYFNFRRQMKKTGLLESSSSKVASDSNVSVEDFSSTTEDNELIAWLEHYTTPWAKVEENWYKSHANRIFINKDITIQMYMKKYPALKTACGYSLLEIDFKIMHPEKDVKLYTKWHELSESMFAYAEKNKNKIVQSYLESLENKEDPNMADIYAIFLLPKIMPAISTVIKDKKQGNWRPSKKECEDGFVVHLQTIDDVEPFFSQKRKKLEKYKLTVQPTPVLIGASLKEINSSYVRIDDMLYKVETPLKAIDICFKSFQALNAKYPMEAEHIWIFIQNKIYDIHTDSDKKFVSVSTLLSDL